MGGLSWWHWLIIIAAFVLLFGAKKLPDAARGIGRSMRILKSEVSAMQEDDSARKKAEPAPPAPAVELPPTQVEPITPTQPVASPTEQHRQA